MLRINLASRPFYNVRVVQVVLGLAVALVVGLTAFNVTQILRLGASQSTLGARASQATLEARRLVADADRIRKQIDPQELQVVANAAREANAIIDQRAFSWTDLLAEFEATLPADVRITAVQPRLEKTSFIVAIAVEARRSEDLDAFIEALERRGSFHNVLSVQEQTNADGLIQAVIEGAYMPSAASDAALPVEGVAR
jgi:type IV pilus assembly protein PilN